MSVIKAYTLPHPPLAVPAVGRGKESKEIRDTLNAMDSVAQEIARIAPETIIYITPHSTVYSDYFHISAGAAASGDLGRFGAPEVEFNINYDTELIDEISRVAEQNAVAAGTLGEKDTKLDHGFTVPMWFINNHYKDYRAIRVSQSGMASAEHYLMGQIIAKSAAQIGRKTVVIASSDLSHRLKEDAPYSFAPEGAQFDSLITESLEKADFLSLLRIPGKIRERAGECGYNSLVMLAGIFDKQDVEAKLLSYEGPFGVGYAVASFSSLGKNEDRNILEKYIDDILSETENRKNSEDEYQKLARESLELAIRNDEIMPIPNGLPSSMLSDRAGTFVSIHKNGQLRGCIGTIAPTTKCIASEIIQNAVSAGLSDERFSPVAVEELPFLVYKVDVLSAPEPILSVEELDVTRYGVIVSCGNRRGLLLPNLDGIDTVEEQVAIARRKGGISEGEKVKLQRFEVIRHG